MRFRWVKLYKYGGWKPKVSFGHQDVSRVNGHLYDSVVILLSTDAEFRSEEKCKVFSDKSPVHIVLQILGHSHPNLETLEMPISFLGTWIARSAIEGLRSPRGWAAFDRLRKTIERSETLTRISKPPLPNLPVTVTTSETTTGLNEPKTHSAVKCLFVIGCIRSPEDNGFPSLRTARKIRETHLPRNLRNTRRSEERKSPPVPLMDSLSTPPPGAGCSSVGHQQPYPRGIRLRMHRKRKQRRRRALSQRRRNNGRQMD